jgi:hypothetical protein
VTAFLLLVQFSRDTSLYQRFKLIVLSVVPLSKDAVHVYVGCACLLAVAAVLRWPLSAFKTLLPGLVLSLLMEAADLRDELKERRLRWRDSVHDIVNTNLVPVVIVTLARRRRLRID